MRFELIISNELYDDFCVIDYSNIHHLPDDEESASLLENNRSQTILSRTKTLLTRAKSLDNIKEISKQNKRKRFSTNIKFSFFKNKIQDSFAKESTIINRSSTTVKTSTLPSDPYDSVGVILDRAFKLVLPSRQEVRRYDIEQDIIETEIQVELEMEEKIQELVQSASTTDFAEALAEVLNDTFQINPQVKVLKEKNLYSPKNVRNFATLLCSIGQVYQYGFIVKQDHIKAFTYYRAAERLGSIHSTYFIAIMYQLGYGVKQDYEQAFIYFKVSANQNLPEALNAIGLCYQHGLGTKMNIREAITCFKTSARLGNADALYNLGYVHENGHRYGIEKDHIVAQYFYDQTLDIENKLD